MAAAAPTYAGLAGGIMGVARETGYGRRRWREEQAAESRARFAADLRLRRDQLEQAAEFTREGLAETRAGRESARALAYEEMAQRAQEKQEDRDAREARQEQEFENSQLLQDLETKQREGLLNKGQELKLETMKKERTWRLEDEKATREYNENLAFITTKPGMLKAGREAVSKALAARNKLGFELSASDAAKLRNLGEALGEYADMDAAAARDAMPEMQRNIEAQLALARGANKPLRKSIKERAQGGEVWIDPDTGINWSEGANGILKSTMPPKEIPAELSVKDKAKNQADQVRARATFVLGMLGKVKAETAEGAKTYWTPDEAGELADAIFGRPEGQSGSFVAALVEKSGRPQAQIQHLMLVAQSNTPEGAKARELLARMARE